MLLLKVLSSVTAAAKSLQSCPTLCDSIDGSPPGSSVPGILQARILEWVAISFSNAWKWKVKVKSLSHVRLFTTPWTVAYQAPPSVGFSRQEYWSGLPLPSVTKHPDSSKTSPDGFLRFNFDTPAAFWDVTNALSPDGVEHQDIQLWGSRVQLLSQH